MKISAHVKSGSKKERVVKIGENQYKIFVKAQPIKGQANQAAISAISSFLKISSRRISIVHGFRSKNKILNVEGV